jgi:metal-sulfur cluster biosynthetic enzyme
MSALPEVPGSGPAEHRGEALAAIDAIADPCSISLGHPIGLAGMGMVERLDVEGGAVSVLLLPTFPTCLFRGVFEEEIAVRLRALPWCTSVAVAFCPAEQDWDESRMSPEALAALRRPARPARRAGRRAAKAAA